MRVVVLEQGDWPDYSKARADHPDFELTCGRYWSGNPNRRQARGGLSDRRRGLRHFCRALQCGGRRHGHLRGALAAQHAVGFSRAHARRRRRRLAAHLRRPRAVLRTGRGGFRRVRSGGRSGFSARQGSAAAARAARADGPTRGARAQSARLALVARRRTRSRRAPMARSSPARNAPRACGVVSKARRVRWTSRIGRKLSSGRAARHRRARAPARNECRRTWSRARNTSIATAVHFQKAAVTVLGANGIGTPRLLLLSASPKFPNGLANSSGPRRPAADDASVRHGGRLVRRRPRQHARLVGPAHSLPGVLRDRCLARFRARREVGPATNGRPAFDDARLSLGRKRDLGNEFHNNCASAWPFRHVGHHRRRFARGTRTASCSIRC